MCVSASCWCLVPIETTIIISFMLQQCLSMYGQPAYGSSLVICILGRPSSTVFHYAVYVVGFGPSSLPYPVHSSKQCCLRVSAVIHSHTLLRLFKEIWGHEVIPMEHSVIISIHKKKGKLDCSNCRGFNFLCHSSKISFIILQRIKGRTEEILAETQCRFRASRSTIDQIFTLRKL